jgi:hypothetical protein
LVATTRQRLCLSPDRDPEVAAALRDLGVDPASRFYLGGDERQLVTLCWDGAAPAT